MMMFAILFAIFLGIAGVYLIPSLRKRVPYPWLAIPLLVTLRGRNLLCSPLSIGSGYRKTLLHHRRKSELQSLCSLIQTDADLQLWNTPSGDYWVPKGSGVRHLCYLLAEQELKPYGNGPEGVRPGDVVLDCGANIGVFSRAAMDLGATLVIAVEPSPENIDCFRRNLHSFIQTGRVKLYPTGLWSSESHLRIQIAPDSCGQNTFVFTAATTHEGPEIRMTTVDALVRELGLERVDFIKMDIEGSEASALAGAQETLSTYKPRMAIEVDHTQNAQQNVRNVVESVCRSVPSYRLKTDLWVVLYKGYAYPGVVHFS